MSIAERLSNAFSYRVLKGTSLVPFGNHRGETINWTLKCDPLSIYYDVSNGNYVLDSQCEKILTKWESQDDSRVLLPYDKTIRKQTRKYTLLDGRKIRICDLPDSLLLGTIAFLNEHHIKKTSDLILTSLYREKNRRGL